MNNISKLSGFELLILAVLKPHLKSHINAELDRRAKGNVALAA